MRITNTRRVLAGLGVAGALVAVAPAPAQAAAIELDVYFPDTTVILGQPGTVAAPILYGSEETPVDGARLTYDLADLAGKVTVTETGSADWCEAAGTTLVCTPGSIMVDPWGSYYDHNLLLEAADGAALGDEGTLKVTFEAEGSAPVSHEATIRVGEGVDLVTQDGEGVTVRPGADFTATAQVTNASTTVLNGAALTIDNNYGIVVRERYSNCFYDGDALRACVFDEPLEPGATYGVDFAYTLSPTAEAPGRKISHMVWYTKDDFADLTQETAAKRSAGTGAKLALREVSRVSARSPQTDPDPRNNHLDVEVTVAGDNPVDLAAIGDTAAGEQGDEVTVTVGLDNLGSAAAETTHTSDGVTNLRVTLPSGTSAVGVPQDCVGRKGNNWGQSGKPFGTLYECDTPRLMEPGDRQRVEFTLRIDEVIPNAAGKVEINFPCNCSVRQSDADKSNDTAKILVNASEGGGGAGGGLPVTGTATGLIAGAGAVLLALGVVGFVFARRRRTRFVA